jgi:anti-sigma factor RsiW
MSCADIRERLDEVAAGELDEQETDRLRAHAAGCAACGPELAALERNLELCQRAGAEPLPEGFGFALRQVLAQAGPPTRSLPSIIDRLRQQIVARPLGFALATAAIAAVLATGATLSWTHRQLPATVVTYRVPSSKVALVKIDFVAAQAIEDVAFEITLPDGLRFVSGGELLAERSFRFVGKLAPGSNPIPIAVKGPRAGRYKLIAHAVGSELDVTQEVLLEVTT